MDVSAQDFELTDILFEDSSYRPAWYDVETTGGLFFDRVHVEPMDRLRDGSIELHLFNDIYSGSSPVSTYVNLAVVKRITLSEEP